MDTPEENATVLSFVQDADLQTAFLVGIHCIPEKIVLILLTDFEGYTATVISGLCVFSPPTFFCCGCFPPTLLQINAGSWQRMKNG